MTKKTDVDKALTRLLRYSPFDKIVREIDAKEIPSKYIERIIVFYVDGTEITLSGNEITHPIPTKKDASWDDVAPGFKKIKDVKVFIDIDKLEKDINALVKTYLGDQCE